MKILRSALALAGLVAVCLVPAACSDGPTSSPAAPQRAIVTDTTKAPSSMSGDSAIAPPCRDGGNQTGSGARC